MDVEYIIFSFLSRYIINLNDSLIHPSFIEFYNVFIARAHEAGILLGKDEDYFRPRAHAATESFRLVVQKCAGVPIDAILGRFENLEAATIADGDPRYSVMALRPAEICIKNGDGIRLGVDGDERFGTSRDQGLGIFDYTNAAKEAIRWLRNASGARFISLFMAAVQSRGVGVSGIRPRLKGTMELIYARRFSKTNDGYKQIIEDRAHRAAKQAATMIAINAIAKDFSAEENRKWQRNILHCGASVAVVIDDVDATLCGIARTAVELGLPSLSVALGLVRFW